MNGPNYGKALLSCEYMQSAVHLSKQTEQSYLSEQPVCGHYQQSGV